MTPGMRITATTPAGTIAITALDELTRAYTWEGATRTLQMWPREERWYGSLGLYYPGPGNHWQEHNGITRAVVEEGQQHFKTGAEALDFLRHRNYMPWVYTHDGLAVGWMKVLPRAQLSVEVWQLLVNGKKPAHLAGSQDDKIVISHIPLKASALIDSVKKGDTDAVRKLLDQGANVNDVDSAGATPLIAAMTSEKSNLQLVLLLLDRGANPNVYTQAGDPLIIGALHEPAVLQAFLHHHADVELEARSGILAGRTALNQAAEDVDLQAAQILLAYGANPNHADARNQTPLHTLCQTAALGGAGKNGSSNEVAFAAALLGHGAQINARDWYGDTPLSLAAMGNDVELVKLLLKHGADVNLRNDVTRKLSFGAAFSGTAKEIAKFDKLLENEQLQADGFGPLDMAEDPTVRKLLTAVGAKSFAAEARKRMKQLGLVD